LALGLIADKKNQEYFELYFLLGDSYYFDNRYEKALEYYFIVLYTEKKHLKHFAYRKIGDCYKVIGNQEKSIENYLSALALTENKEQIRRINQDLGFSFYNIKNYKEAKSHLNYALQLAYEKYEKSGLDYKSRVRKIIYTLNIIEQQLKL
jgi:tetratricopeptide (TPR) repeat protein